MHSLALALMVMLALKVVHSQFSEVPSDEIVSAGNNLTITCVYPNATSISWEKDGSPVSSGHQFSVTPLPSEPDGSTLTLIEASVPTHNGSYECIADLDGGQRMATEFSVVVAFLGNVTADLETPPCFNGIFYVRASLSFRCLLPASNPPIVNVSWYYVQGSGSSEQLLGFSLPDFSSTPAENTYSIPILKTVDAGNYFCRVDNGVLSRDSNRVLLPPVMSIVPSDDLTITSARDTSLTNQQGNIIILAKEGGATSITCSFSPYIIAFPALSWSRNSAGIVSGSRNTDLFVNPKTCQSTLSIGTLSAIHVGRYSCQTRVGDQPISVDFRLSIATIPQRYRLLITPSQGSPERTSVGVGTRIDYHCEEYPPNQDHNVEETISWRFQRAGTSPGGPVTPDGTRVIVGPQTLSITNVALEDAGAYTCQASNALVEPILTSTRLVVEEPFPLNITSPVSVSAVILGTTIALTCAIGPTTSFIPRPGSLSWTVDGSPISPDALPPRYSISFNSISNSSTSSVLTIVDVMEADLGVVSCMAVIPYQLPTTDSINLAESTEPYFLGNRTSSTELVPEGTRPFLSCPIRSVPPTTEVRWEMGDRQLGKNEGVEIRAGNGSWTLEVLHDVTLSGDDNSHYTCVVLDGNYELKYTFTLYITQPVVIISGPQANVNATEGSPFRLTCKAAGRPPPQVFWLHMGMPVKGLDDSSVQDFGNGTLYFEKVEKKDSGFYLCFTQSNATDVVAKMQTFLTVEPEPSDRRVAGLNPSEAALIFALVGAVTIMIIVACVTLIITICCFSDTYRGSYNVAKQISLEEEDAKAFLKQSSLQGAKGNSRVLMGGPPKPMFDSFQHSIRAEGEESSYLAPSDEVGMRTFIPDGNSYIRDSNNYSTSSLDRGTTLSPSHTLSTSHKPSPPHVTLASASLFESEMEEDLTNFPRINVRLGECLGQGEFGPVMRGVAKALGQHAEVEVAVKLLVSEAMGEGEEEEGGGFRADLAVTDYSNQMKLRHRNVVPILGICSDIEPYYIIYEYLDKGDLKHFLRTCRPEEDAPPPLSSLQLLHVVLQVAQGMKYLFSQHIIHGDIATRNCMINTHMDVKIGDLGIGHELYEGDYYDNGSQLLPIRWMPPDLLVSSEEGPSFSLHSDIWAFGVFCWEVWTYAQLPYDRYSDEEVLDMVPAGSRLRNPSRSCPPELYLVMMDCWSDQPQNRPQFGTICTALEQLCSTRSI